jgi:SAM-dependent methyltransferase
MPSSTPDLGRAYRSALRFLQSWVPARLEGATPGGADREPSLGRLASTLLECGERTLGGRVVARLIESQRADGSWSPSAGRSAERETAEAVHGLLTALPSLPGTAVPLQRACGWLLGLSHPLRDPNDSLAVAEALDRVAGALDESRFRAPAPELPPSSRITRQDDPGALLERLGPAPGPDLPAAAVELLEAIHRHIAAAFATQVGDFEDRIRSGDGRFGFLLREGRFLPNQRVLDAGCGRGAVARALLTSFPGLDLFAVDLSPEMLRHVPAAARPRRGSIQNLPFEDDGFDLVYCIEALEHAGNPEGAVDELCRVARPGGRVLIVDKNLERAGALPIESWESWFSRTEVECWLGRHCNDVGSELLLHCPELGSDLFVGWHGTRR